MGHVDEWGVERDAAGLVVGRYELRFAHDSDVPTQWGLFRAGVLELEGVGVTRLCAVFGVQLSVRRLDQARAGAPAPTRRRRRAA